MANLKRYNTNAVGMCGNVEMFVFEHGDWVKFDDIKELLNTSTNTGSPKLLALADQAIAQLETMSLHQALDTVKELRKQLRAGA